MADVDLYAIPDGETLRVLPTGLEIIRREKHEWKRSLENLSPEQLTTKTSKRWGSKFYPDWTLPVIVNWIESTVLAEGWPLRPGVRSETERVLDRDIGLVAGKATRRIKIVCDGRYVHAYPIQE
jgi:hypothetical protein